MIKFKFDDKWHNLGIVPKPEPQSWESPRLSVPFIFEGEINIEPFEPFVDERPLEEKPPAGVTAYEWGLQRMLEIVSLDETSQKEHGCLVYNNCLRMVYSSGQQDNSLNLTRWYEPELYATERAKDLCLIHNHPCAGNNLKWAPLSNADLHVAGESGIRSISAVQDDGTTWNVSINRDELFDGLGVAHSVLARDIITTMHGLINVELALSGTTNDNFSVASHIATEMLAASGVFTYTHQILRARDEFFERIDRMKARAFKKKPNLANKAIALMENLVLAPRDGLEPSTARLTVGCSTN